MRLKNIALTLLLFTSVSPSLSARSLPIPVSATSVSADRLPDTKVRLGKVTVTKDVVYSTIPGYRPLLLDLYTPAGKGRRPLIVYIHGGSWTNGSKRSTANFQDFPGVLAALAGQGYTVASVDYRLSSEAKFPAAVQDIKAAIRYLRANANRYGIDRSRVAVWGASAGAHLAAMTAFTGDEASLEPVDRSNPDQSDSVQALVGWYGTYELPGMFRYAMSAPPVTGVPMSPEEASEITGPLNFFGCTMDGCPPEIFVKGSPISFVDKHDPPTLLIHGTSDTRIPSEQSVELYNALKASGVKTDLLLIDRASHDWLGNNQKATASASRKAVAVTFDWLRKVFSEGGK
ncbi:MAG: alpha/beta hydrolase [Chlorobiaceae bacterium]|nr:alpha/beta hydrolase [Chlorobiaceae bacterium]